MATVREHVSKEIHEAAAAHEDALHDNAMEFAALHKTFHKESGLTDGPHQEMAAKWEDRARLHKGYSEHHRAAAAKCSKAAEGGDLSKQLFSDRVSGVTPPTPFGIRAIPRTGQREIGTPNVDPQFADLVRVEDSLD